MLRLKNNVVLITEAHPSSSVAAIGFYFATGSRYEGAEERGISHFCEHLLFKGYAAGDGSSARTTRDIARAFDRMGGSVNAFTERDAVCLHCTVPVEGGGSRNVAVAVELLCGMASRCTFPPEEVERERGVVLNEIAAAADDSEECALDAVAAAVWQGQALGYPIAGRERDVAALSRERLLEWYDRSFVHGELVVAACGRVDEASIAAVLERLPEHRPVAAAPRRFAEPARWQGGATFVSARFGQTQLFSLHPFAMPISKADYYALLVFNALTGDTMSSRLFESLRERSGLCYTVYSYVTTYEDAGFWCAYASCDRRNAVRTGALLREELARLAGGGVEADEVEAAKEHLCGEEVICGGDMEYCMKRAQRNFLMGLPLDGTAGVLAAVRAVEADDVAAVARRLLAGEGRAFVAYGPRLSVRERRALE